MPCDLAFEHSDRGDLDEGGGAFDGFFEALGGIGSLDDLDSPVAVSARGLAQFVAGLAAIGLEHAVKKWNPVFHKKACDNNKIRA
jgi:hypothetical protein